MEKNWLIRTKTNHILGPISKEKLLELYKNGSIKPDDEICCGNGFWFFLREEDMVKRFLTGRETQGFNPVSEAKDVLTLDQYSAESMEPQDDITQVGGISLKDLREDPGLKAISSVEEEAQESEESLSEDLYEAPSQVAESKQFPTGKKKVRTEKVSQKNIPAKKPPLKNHSYMMYFFLFGCCVIFLLLMYRKNIIKYFFQGEIVQISFELIPNAKAQDEVLEKKKSS